MWNFKGTLWNSTQNILPIHWKIWFLYDTEILRALKFKSSNAFLKCPPGFSEWIIKVYSHTWNQQSAIMLHKSHKAPVPYPTMHHFVTEMCTCVLISVTKWYIVGYLIHCEICDIGQLSDTFEKETILICANITYICPLSKMIKWTLGISLSQVFTIYVHSSPLTYGPLGKSAFMTVTQAVILKMCWKNSPRSYWWLFNIKPDNGLMP